MAENRFSKFRAAAQPQAQAGNRFSRFKKVPQAPEMPVQSVNQDGKGDMPMTAGQIAMDAAKAGGVGIAQGVLGMGGLIGDTQELAGNAAGFIADKFGASRETASAVKDIASRYSVPIPGAIGVKAPTTENLTNATKQVTGEFYQPKTVAGEYANTIGQFAPNALAGPGGVGAKVGVGLTSAVLSETAGQATKGSEYEGAARIAGALAGGLKGVKGGNVTKQIAKNAPTQEAVKGQADNLYKELRNAGIVYDTNTFDRSMNFLSGKLKSEGVFQQDAPRAFGAVERLAKMVGGRIEFGELESVRKQAGAILREGPAVSDTDKMAARVILDTLDQFATRAPVATNGKTPASQVSILTKQAREMAQRNIITKQFDEMARKSENYPSGFENGMKQQIKSYLNSPKGASLRRNNPEVYNAFQQAQKGGFTRKIMETLGRFGIDLSSRAGISSLLPAAAGSTAYYSSGGDLTKTAAATAAFSGARFAGRKMVAGDIERARNVVLAGRGKQKQVTQNVRQQALEARLRALLAAESGRLGSQE